MASHTIMMELFFHHLKADGIDYDDKWDGPWYAWYRGSIEAATVSMRSFDSSGVPDPFDNTQTLGFKVKAGPLTFGSTLKYSTMVMSPKELVKAMSCDAKVELAKIGRTVARLNRKRTDHGLRPYLPEPR